MPRGIVPAGEAHAELALGTALDRAVDPDVAVAPTAVRAGRVARAAGGGIVGLQTAYPELDRELSRADVDHRARVRTRLVGVDPERHPVDAVRAGPEEPGGVLRSLATSRRDSARQGSGNEERRSEACRPPQMANSTPIQRSGSERRRIARSLQGQLVLGQDPPQRREPRVRARAHVDPPLVPTGLEFDPHRRRTVRPVGLDVEGHVELGFGR